MPYRDPRKPELDEIAQEINGRNLTTGKRLDGFAELKDDGTTTAGDWIYTGHYPESGNLTKRRDGVQDPTNNDPTGMGFYPNWAWSWPANRRVLYNRASADPQGRPWDPTRAGIQWDAAAGKWIGDVPDYPATADPTKPNAPLPFIMTGEGTGRLFSNGVADGPFPEHYEPVESPIENPLHPDRVDHPGGVPLRRAWRAGPTGSARRRTFPYVATSYRLTEHEHYVTQHVEHLVQLQPEAFVEIPAELAAEKGIETGDHVRVSSKRGKLEVRAVVTKRLGPLQIDGKKVYQIGIPIHWGFVGINTGQHWLANALTPVRRRRQRPHPRVQGVPGQHREDVIVMGARDSPSQAVPGHATASGRGSCVNASRSPPRCWPVPGAARRLGRGLRPRPGRAAGPQPARDPGRRERVLPSVVKATEAAGPDALAAGSRDLSMPAGWSRPWRPGSPAASSHPSSATWPARRCGRHSSRSRRTPARRARRIRRRGTNGAARVVADHRSSASAAATRTRW